MAHFVCLFDNSKVLTKVKNAKNQILSIFSNGWAIDPFGLSSTMSYILKRAGFNTSLIQRTHYAVKKHMAWNKDLEFMWRQHWGKNF